MKNPNKLCSKCRAEMQKGRLYTVSGSVSDINELFGYVNWEAVDLKRHYSGLFAYRCKKCGFLEFYSE
jgi:predicted nucleic-acid-binding Zn-ribbon protein